MSYIADDRVQHKWIAKDEDRICGQSTVTSSGHTYVTKIYREYSWHPGGNIQLCLRNIHI